MASESKKDLTSEAALQAVEEALALDLTSDSGKDRKPDTAVDEPLFDADFAELETKLAEAANDLRRQNAETAVPRAGSGLRPRRTAAAQASRTAPAPAAPPARDEQTFAADAGLAPANDDRRNKAADLVYALQRQSSSRISWFAGILSLAWLGLCGAVGYFALRDGLIQPSAMSNLAWVALGGAIIVPLLLFWAFAAMIKRAQEMKLAARTMTEAAIRLLQPEEVAADSIATIGRAIRREVASIGDGVERALGRASELETMVQSEVRNLERSYTDSEIRLRGLVSELSAERVEIVNHAERLRESLSYTHSGLTDELEQVTGRIQSSIDEATVRMSDALRMRHETITSTLSEAGNNLVSLLSASGGEIEGTLNSVTDKARIALAEKTQEMGKQVNMIGQAVAKLIETRTAGIRETGETVTREIEMALGARAIEFTSRLDLIESNVGERGKALLDLLGTQADQLSHQFDRLDQNMTTKGSELVNALGMRTQALDKVLGELATAVDDTIAQRLTGFGQTLTNKVGKVVDELGQKHESLETLATRIGEAIDGRATRIEETLRERTADLSKAFNDGDQAVRSTIEYGLTGSAEAANRIASLVEERNKTLTREIDTRVTGLTVHMDDRVKQIRSILDDRVGQITVTLDDRASMIDGALGERTRVLAEELENRTSEFVNKVEEQTVAITGGLDQRTAGFLVGLEKRASFITTKMDERTSAFEAGMEERTESLLQGLDSRATVIAREFDTHASAMTKGLDLRTDALTEGLDQRTASLLIGLDKRSTIIADELDKRSQAITGGIDQRTTSLLGGLDSRANEIAGAIEVRAGAIAQSIDSGTNSLLRGLDARAGEISGAIDKRTNVFTHELDQRAARILGGLDERTHAIASAMEQRRSDLAGDFDKRAANLLSGLDQRANFISGALEERSSEIVRGVDEKTSIFVEKLDQRATLLAQVVEEKNKALITAISAETQHTGEALDKKAERLTQILTERAAAINSTLGTGLLDAQRNLEDKSGDLNRMLSERVRELNDVLENQARPVVEAISSRGMDVSTRLGALHKTVATDIVELLQQLAGTSDALQKLLDTAGARMSSMQETITTHARDLTTAVDKANRDVSHSTQVAQSAQQKMDVTAGGLVSTISGIAERFEEQGMMLQHATRLIDAAQANLSTTLEEKQQSLHALATGLAERTETIERTMGSFGEMLRKSLDEVSEKSRSVGSLISTEVGTAIEQANMRFAKSVEVMRQAAQDVQRDLEETREQMRRGVLELPDETRESAESMRKVVADQIAALRELSEIVARSGKTIEPAVPQRIAAANTQATAAAAATGSFGRGRPEATVTSLPPLTQARRPEPQETRAYAAPQPHREPAPTARAPLPRSAPAPRAAPAAETAAPGQGGWVSDLLRRASRDDEEFAPRGAAAPTQNSRTPLHVVESLNSLSMDIARAIDHDAFIDLWERYQRGERNAFTRRLYTLQGEQTFDEIRQKYTREPEFRAAVDRYITDFEKLLADVSRNDRDNMMTQTYLSSDTGKVYTMLAHAAGRFSG